MYIHLPSPVKSNQLGLSDLFYFFIQSEFNQFAISYYDNNYINKFHALSSVLFKIQALSKPWKHHIKI